MISDIVIVVVLYNSLPKDYYQILHRYNIRLIIVDNTPNQKLEINDTHIDYLALHRNMGIAYALNIGCQRAMQYQAKWVLSLDQDSEIPSNMIPEYIKFIDTRSENIGIVCPLINVYHGDRQIPSCTIDEVNETLSSGSLINLNAYQKAGGFRNELFIDSVDFEFCYHIRALDYRIYRLNYVIMQHKLGETQDISFCGIHLFYITHHNYIRHYYMQRNTLYVAEMYHKNLSGLNFIKRFQIKSLIKILFFERDKMRKIRARYQGYLDYKNRKFGKFEGL